MPFSIKRQPSGKTIGLGRSGEFIATEGIVAARHNIVEDFDDFLGDVLADQWAFDKGSDGGAANFASSAHTSGMVRATTGAGAGGSMAANGVQLVKFLGWKANQGRLLMEARVKLSAITNIALFVGFSDQVASLEMPIHSAASANTITTNATDAVGFMFDTSMTADNFWLVGVKNDTDATAQNSAIAPVAATWVRLRVVLDTSGNAEFFINGARVGTGMTEAITATVALSPVVAAFTRTAASQTVDVDYVQIIGTRV